MTEQAECRIIMTADDYADSERPRTKGDLATLRLPQGNLNVDVRLHVEPNGEIRVQATAWLEA